ncbi:MAG: ASKHA domain-containing protein, partial [Desulfotomaculaceae bacterium]|nr:ASKHA domain-containing protein [Desulfotomaculaceae bacterium]
GSGLLALVAELLDAGVILPSGKMATKKEYREAHPGSPLIGVNDDSQRRFWLAPPVVQGERGVYLSQTDVRQLQLAKGAIVAGIKTLLARSELEEDDVKKVYLAGAFGAYVDPRNLIRLGVLPAAWQDRICFAGNSSKAGAAMALLSGATRLHAEEISRKVDYFELSKCCDFEKLFVCNMSFTYE